eukprot:gb/GEZN01007171.1/.p1 GENE.gb/GEZN01007171.1/~~gb/GEZN01007171.1/.p1  ORF type:complete len:487 (+),score=72.67 gb/GEZN01007171.1/:62-1462(+)
MSEMLNTLLASALQPAEVIALFRVKFGRHVKRNKRSLAKLAKTLNDRDFCYAALNKVSRSFAIVIQQLNPELMDAVCVFYLVLRGLDSVEDDMEFPLKDKLPALRNFYQKLEDPDFSMPGVGDTPDYKMLMSDFQKVVREYHRLAPKYRKVVSDITRLMGAGMADFAQKGSVQTMQEFDLYCHYVAGLVGYGLSGLWAESGLEDPKFKEWKGLSNSMGLFLQKTNIIRDYLEDLDGGRTWYPKDIWSKYAGSLAELRLQPTSRNSLGCLNELITNTLELALISLDYLSRLRDPQNFSFCAIPQVMAIATLAEIYNNPNVFRKEVKIRKGLSCKIMLNCNSFEEVLCWFHIFARDMRDRVPDSDPSSKRTAAILDDLLERTRPAAPSILPKWVLPVFVLVVVLWADSLRSSPVVGCAPLVMFGVTLLLGLLIVFLSCKPTPPVSEAYRRSFQHTDPAPPDVPTELAY